MQATLSALEDTSQRLRKIRKMYLKIFKMLFLKILLFLFGLNSSKDFKYIFFAYFDNQKISSKLLSVKKCFF
jgi:hypothetical protein